MPKLTDTQLVILSAAAQRDDGAVLPLPKSLKINKGAVARVLQSLVKHGLLAEQPAARDDEVWRQAEDGQRMMLVISDAGLQAIGLEPDLQATKRATATKPNPKKGGGRAKQSHAARKPKGKKRPPAIRHGTKQALLIDLFKRKNGATIAEASKATGWQAHSVRGAISGSLKKKLGLKVTSETIEGRGRVYHVAARG